MATLKIPVGSQDHIEGNAKAPCTLVEYGDYECPHCGAAYPLVKQIQKHFGKKLRFVFRNFPMTNLHANAQAAAEVAEFAGTKGRFWEMHDLIFENQNRLGDDLFIELAEKLKSIPPSCRKPWRTGLLPSMCATISVAGCAVESMAPRPFSSTASGITARWILITLSGRLTMRSHQNQTPM